MSHPDWKLTKRTTGLRSLDRLLHGGLPENQATLILGQAGTGKTVLSLHILAEAIRRGEGGVFLSFEESPAQLKRNVDSFAWGGTLHESDDWSVIDVRDAVGMETAGEFDIEALMAAISARAKRFERPWIVIDGIDQMMKHQPEPSVAVEQIRQVNERCADSGWTLLLSGKLGNEGVAPRHLEGIEYMLPTMLLLKAQVINRRLQRRARVSKYRGSAHVTDEVPMVINDQGIQFPYQTSEEKAEAIGSTERVSSGVTRLDDVMGGGPYRGSSILISGRPGTAKSTLAAGFAEAAAERGEKALYISFDEMEAPYVRNLASVNIDLQPHIDQGRIRFHALHAWSALLSEHVLTIDNLIEDFRPDFLVIDPLSALVKAAGSEEAQPAIERILDRSRRLGITTVMTSLIDENDPEGESTMGSVSTIADTWLVLGHNVRAGERNRSLSIVKSRGTAHSNQQRELLLSSEGIDLADVYEYGTEVLMGTARAQKAAEQREIENRLEMERIQRRQDLQRRLEQARSEMERLQSELELTDQESEETRMAGRRHTKDIQQRRESRAKDEP